MNKLVISVNISKFRLELAMNRDATIQELVRSMRDNNFFPEDIKTEDLLFLNKNGETLNLQDKVESIVVEPTQPIHFLDVQMKNQMEIDQSSMQGFSVVSQSQKSEVKTNPSSKILQENPISVLYKQFDEAPSKLKPEKVIKVLEAVQRGLEDNDLDDFINNGSSSEISKSIRAIAIKCRELLNEKKFFEQICFGIIPISRPEELSTFTREILEQEFKGERSIDEYLFDIAMNLYELKQRELTGQQTILKEKNDKKKVSQELQKIKKQNQAQKKEIACLKIEIQTKQLDLDAMVRSKDDEIQNEKTLLRQMEQNFKTLQGESSALKGIVTEKNKKIDDQETQISLLKDEIDQKIREIQEVRKEVQNKRENSSLAILNSIERRTKRKQQAQDSYEKFTKNLKIEAVFPQVTYLNQVKEVILKHGRLCVISAQPLISYKKDEHTIFQLDKKLHQYIDDKESLMLIAQTVEGKTFGAFTEQKLQVSSYICPDFEGFAFLFNFNKDKEIQPLFIKKEKRSMLYVSSSIEFGDSDLVIDVKNNTAENRMRNGNVHCSFTSQSDKLFKIYESFISETEPGPVTLQEFYVFELKLKVQAKIT